MPNIKYCKTIKSEQIIFYFSKDTKSSEAIIDLDRVGVVAWILANCMNQVLKELIKKGNSSNTSRIMWMSTNFKGKF